MKARYQILSWTLLILVLGLILLDKLRDASTSADVPTNGVQADLAQIDLAKFFESNLLAPQEKLSDNAPNKNQFKEVSKEGLKAQTESPFSHPNIATGSTNVYYVRKDDTLWLIARAHNLDLYTLLSFNKLENPNLIRPGQAIKITRWRGILHTDQSDDSPEDIALRHEPPLQSITNTILNTDAIQAGTAFLIPSSKISEISPSGLLQMTPSWFVKPAQGKIADGFGYHVQAVLNKRLLHKGIDILGGYDSDVKAAMGGLVRYAGEMGSYGKLVIINHHGRYETRYAHNSKIDVKKGQIVEQGQVIARIGNTGCAKDTHLHFEIRENGVPVDPMKLIKH